MSKTHQNLTGTLVDFILYELYHILYNEIEPNDTRSQAQEIQENQSTPEGMYNPTLGGTYQMNGNSSINDEDWFKVNLTKGTKYMTCGEKAFDFLIEDSAGNVITEKAYSTSPRVFAFEIPADGLYYVRIKGISSEQTKYLFYVGSPVYAVGSVIIPCNTPTINMTGGTKTAYFDSTNLNIPKNAVVTSLTFNNIRTTDVKSIILTNNNSGINLTMNQSSWDKDHLESMHLPAVTMWTAQFGYNKTTSFNPTIKMYYVYPIYP
jgi:hypothetical protein